MPTHAQAAAIIREEWPKIHGREATNNEVLFTQAVALLETGYGRAGQHGEFAKQGLFNWANIEKIRQGDTCEPGWVAGKDQGNVCFRVYPSDNEAASALIKTLTTRHWPVIEAIRDEATPEAVAHAMKVKPAYYAADEALYAKAIGNAIKSIGQPIQQSKAQEAATTAAKSISTGTTLAVGGIAAGGVAYAVWKLFFGDK